MRFREGSTRCRLGASPAIREPGGNQQGGSQHPHLNDIRHIQHMNVRSACFYMRTIARQSHGEISRRLSLARQMGPTHRRDFPRDGGRVNKNSARQSLSPRSCRQRPPPKTLRFVQTSSLRFREGSTGCRLGASPAIRGPGGTQQGGTYTLA